MSDPVDVMLAIDRDAERLDELEKLIGESADLLERAEEAWLEIYDRVAEDLKDEMQEQARKGDPAEHWVTSVARRQHRVEYSNLRRAKRAYEKFDKQIGAKKAAMNGRQSELAVLRDELNSGRMLAGHRETRAKYADDEPATYGNVRA